MTTGELLHRRLVHQQIGGQGCSSPAEIVAALGAMQAQEYAMAKWAIGLRVPDTNDIIVEASLDAGAILRTHLLRPTWHFVAPADIRWLLALSAPRVRAAMAYRHRELALDAALLRRCRRIIARALSGGKHLPRAALQLALRRARITADGERMGHIMMDAELAGLVCSGPRLGKQFTYALLDERVPAAPPLEGDAALAELSRRYFRTRGPATAHDFAWWSGLTVTDARRGIALLGAGFHRETIGDRVHVFSDPPPRACPPLRDFLMPDYDEYGISYQDRSALLGNHDAPPPDPRAFNRHVILDGRSAGRWRRIDSAGRFDIEVVSRRALPRSALARLTAAADRFAAFFGREADVRVIAPAPKMTQKKHGRAAVLEKQ